MEIITPMPIEEYTGNSSLSLTFCGGTSLTMYSAGDAPQDKGQCDLQLAPGKAIVIGRQEGGKLEYLDPAYQSTQIMPDSAQRVVGTCGDKNKDNWVSRGHFTLRGSSQ